MVVSGSNGALCFWAVDEQVAPEYPRPMKTEEPVTALANTTVNGRPVIFVGTSKGSTTLCTISRFPPVTEGLVKSFAGPRVQAHHGPVVALEVSRYRGQTVVVSAGDDGAIRIWNLEDLREIMPPLAGHSGPVTQLTILEKQGREVLVSAGEDGTVRLWDFGQDDVSTSLLRDHDPVSVLDIQAPYKNLYKIDVGSPIKAIIAMQQSTIVVHAQAGLIALNMDPQTPPVRLAQSRN